MWYVCFAAAAGVREGFHIRITALQDAAPATLRKLMYRFSDVVVGLCGAAMIIWGMQLVIGTWNHIEPGLEIRRGLVYLCLPISGALIVIFALERLTGAVPEMTDRSED
jgi:TRAP-type C4-dicarboxylate transport system permease small subunit